MGRLWKCVVLIIAIVGGAPPAAAQMLGPYKDEAYAYPPIITSEFGGDYRVFAYDETRQAKRQPATRGHRILPSPPHVSQRDLVSRTNVGDIAHVAAGREGAAALIVVYLHGRGGTRRQGVDDGSAGGNFNRIKTMVVQAGGLYLSPDFSEFGERGAVKVAALLRPYMAASPGAPVFLACGSMGGAICYWLAEDATIAARLGGLLLLGTYPDDTFLASEAFRLNVPVLIAQGTSDTVYNVEWMEAFFSAIRIASPGYPVKMVSFDRGTHGAPIRMVDWRETINWMLSVDR